MVEHLSDSLTDTSSGAPKASWADRKRSYLRRLAEAPSDVLAVSVADKLHNCRSILDDHREIGSEVWVRFNETRPAAAGGLPSAVRVRFPRPSGTAE